MSDILGADQLSKGLDRLVTEIAQRCEPKTPLAMVGVRSRGDVLARRLQKRLEEKGIKVSQQGVLDITLYRDDLDQVGGEARVRKTDINFDLSDYVVILVDDVLFTGRTARAALDALMDFGRPRAIRLAVLVDRGGRELPIQADFVGLELSETNKHVQIKLLETDGEDQIILRD